MVAEWERCEQAEEVPETDALSFAAAFSNIDPNPVGRRPLLKLANQRFAVPSITVQQSCWKRVECILVYRQNVCLLNHGALEHSVIFRVIFFSQIYVEHWRLLRRYQRKYRFDVSTRISMDASFVLPNLNARYSFSQLVGRRGKMFKVLENHPQWNHKFWILLGRYEQWHEFRWYFWIS